MNAPDPYDELARLAEEAATLAEQDRLDELEPIFDRSAAVARSLPNEPPATARSALERAAAAQQRVAARLGSSLAELRVELDRVERGRNAARSYGGTAVTTLDHKA